MAMNRRSRIGSRSSVALCLTALALVHIVATILMGSWF